jgi:tetratricopeptide (TPR) repeat protein
VTGIDDLAGLLRRLRRRQARLRGDPPVTYRELAARTGWSLGIVAQYFAGRSLPPTDRFDTLVQLLGAAPVEQGMLATARDRVEERRRRTRPTTDYVPRLLPAPVSGFTGRAAGLAWLNALLDGGTPAAVVISAIAGTAGVGKTALAIHWAHQVAGRFPDGQLYVNLRGFDPIDSAMTTTEALRAFFDAFEVAPARIPASLDGQVGLYRSLLAGRRVLLLLDNARDEAQVRPLLPATAGCLAVVTSRNQLAGLVAIHGLRPLLLDVLSPPEARDLLTTRLGEERVAAEPDAVDEIITRCARLPLALAVVAARGLTHPARPLARLAEELRDVGGSLTALSTGDPAADVRTVFSWSYRILSPEAARVFRLIGLHRGPDISLPAAASLAGVPVPAARAPLAELTRAHLLIEHAAGRYACHDLLRLYARGRCERDDSGRHREAALRRLYQWYLCSADAAARMLYPEKVRLPLPAGRPGATPPAGSADAAEATAWLDAERPNLVAAVAHAAECGPRPLAWHLADTLRGYFYLRMYSVEWQAVARAGLAAARTDDDPLGQAAARISLADLDWRQGRHQQAIDHYSRAAKLCGDADWPEGQAAALVNLGTVYWQSGSVERAADNYRQALDLNRRAGKLAGQAMCLGNLGTASWVLGRLTEAADLHLEALALHRKIGSAYGEALALNNIGETYQMLGRLDEALDHLTRALDLHRGIGNRGSAAETLRCLAAVHRDAGRLGEAADHGAAALMQSRDTGSRRSEVDALNALASIAHRRGEHSQAIEDHRRALHLTHEISSRYPQAEALLGMAAAHRALGQPGEALDAVRHALRVSRAGGYRVLEGQAMTVLARLRLDQGRTDDAVELARQAVVVHEGTGHRHGLAMAYLLLGDADDRAGAYRRQAVDILDAMGSPIEG